MLRELSVRDLALIERVDLDFAPGFNVLTGETGAGKSILVDAIALALGGRAAPDAVRAGAERARVDALFEVGHLPALASVLEELGLEAEEGTLLVARELGPGGRSACRVNGRPATLSMLRRLAPLLVEIQGQHEFQRLFRPEEHLALLDASGGEELARARAAFGARARAAAELERRLRRLAGSEQERLQRLDLLRYQIDEIAAAGLRAGEEAELAERRQVLAHARRLLEAAAAAHDALAGGSGPGLAAGLARCAEELGRLAAIDPRLRAPAELLREAAVQAEEAAGQLRRYRDGLEVDPAELERVEERLELLRRLQKKYGPTAAAILEYRRRAEEELARLAGAAEEAAALEGQLAGLRSELAELAGALRAARRRAAERLERAVEAELAALAMPGARFRVALSACPDPDGLPVEGEAVAWDERGADRAEFLFSANPGEEPQPLGRVASGGEAARVMLALRSALAGADATPTLVFDEVDAGLGGRAAQAVAARLAGLARSHQVLCVTHLASVAAAADRHIVVSKRPAGGRTVVEARVLAAEERAPEIARMLAGVVGEPSLAHARALLAEAARARGA